MKKDQTQNHVMQSRDEYLAAQAERVKNRPPKHPRWNELSWAIGYVDSNGAVHGKLIFIGDKGDLMHFELFPGLNRYKTWRWNKGMGMMRSETLVDLETDDEKAVENWLLKNGCLNDWEL